MITNDPTDDSADEGFEGPDIERSARDTPVTDSLGDSELDDSADSYVSPARNKDTSTGSGSTADAD